MMQTGLKKVYRTFEDFFPGIMLFSGLTLIFVNVLLRYFWQRPQSFIDEMAVYFVVWGILAGFAPAQRDNYHIKVEFFYERLGPASKKIVDIFALSLSLFFALLYTWFGLLLVQDYLASGQCSADSRFPLWVVYLIVPLSGLMLSARFALPLWQNITAQKLNGRSADRGKGCSN
ncbi:MAG: TRAP transporter small permease [Desulfurispora sp.]|uniref:TRAP transporter small permease n=1 Tax=Desulfurispora sp. TaxID=3014275 RepID=UPI00404AF36F